MKWWHIILYVGLIVFRFTDLDQDVPVYQLANVCQEDEPYYSQGAIFKACKDDGRIVKGFEHTNMEGLDMYNRPLVYLSLKLFGNNYWGLRIPDVLISILFLLLINSIFKLINPANEFINIILFLVLTNFYLFTFSRYTNPQIFSVFVITFALWIFIRYGYEKPVTVIAAGFVAAFTVFFVYIMNFFLLAGIGLFLLIKAIKQKRYLLPIYFLIGIIACFLLFIVSLSLIDSNLSIVYTKITTYGGGNNNILIKRENLTAIFGSIFRSIAAISNTGFFRFQLPLLLGLVFAIPLLIFKVACKSDKTKDIALLVLLVLFMQCLQNFFALSYPFKKMIVVMPVVLIALYLVISDLDFKLLVNTFVRKVIMVCVLVGAILVCLFNFKANKSPSFWSYSGAGCFGTTPLWFDVINIVTCVVLAIAFIAALFFYNKNNLIVVKAIFVVSVLANFMLTYTVYVNNRKYQIRDCLVSLEPMLNNKIVTGWFPFSYQLYTQCEPALNGYDIDFISKSHNAVFDSLVVNRKVDFVIDKVMPSQAIPHKNSTDLTLIKVYHFDCYSYYLYKNSHK